MLSPISLLAVGLYGIAVVAAAFKLQAQQPGDPTQRRSGRLLAIAGWLGLVTHGIALHADIVLSSGLSVGVGGAISLIGWVLALLIMSALVNRPIEGVAVLALPVAAAAAITTHWLPSPVHTEEAGVAIQVHAAISVLAYGILLFATIQAAVFGLQEKRLRERRPGRITRLLPALQHQEALLVQLLYIGFALLTLSLLSGFTFVHDLFAQHLAHKTALSLLAWLVYLVLLIGRRRNGWRGATLARWTFGGFVLLLLGYLGTKWILEIGFGRTWTS